MGWRSLTIYHQKTHNHQSSPTLSTSNKHPRSFRQTHHPHHHSRVWTHQAHPHRHAPIGSALSLIKLPILLLLHLTLIICIQLHCTHSQHQEPPSLSLQPWSCAILSHNLIIWSLAILRNITSSICQGGWSTSSSDLFGSQMASC